MKQKSETSRIETSGQGFGEADESMIRRRAAELAKADGRSSPSEYDLQAAREELAHPLPEATELEIEESARPGNGEPPASQGKSAPRLEPDDEQSQPDTLVREGIEEADHDSRTQAGDRS